MTRNFARDWMWSEACEMLARAEKIHRAFSSPAAPRMWEPPADILETESELLVFVALPGVDPDSVDARIEDGHLIIAAVRVLPPELRSATIHRLELPQGRFLRHLPLPHGQYVGLRLTSAEGCLLIKLEKADYAR